jgi:hypothetical protein
MKIETIPYNEYLKDVPKFGNHILGQQTESEILVYQAFNHPIADYAIQNQCFGGTNYNFSRMTWIKPNFLWMMHRCGWAEKVNQERVLGIWLTKDGFTKILMEAVYSSYQPEIYSTKENWKAALKSKKVRLQWDPDHNIYGEKQERKAIQLGLKNKMVKAFNDNMIREIIDLTDFVKEQKSKIRDKNIGSLIVPKETIFKSENEDLNSILRLENEDHR